MIKTKKQMFIVIGAFILVMLLGTVTYAFFNYTRTGSTNTVGVGRIYFNTDQGNDTLTLTNIFPMTSTQAQNANLDSVSVHIEGDTTYDDGEEFEITLVNVTNTVGNKVIPINYTATYVATTNKEIGTESSSYSDYFTDRGSSSSKYTLEETGEVTEGKQVLVGFIPKNGEVDGTLTIKAYIDSSRIAISDTYDGTESANMGTTTEWVSGRTVLTTTEWNSLQGNSSLSFKIKAEANEGTWVEESLSRNDMKHIYTLFSNGGAFYGQKSSLTEINFIRMSEEEINTHANVADLTDDNGQGVVKAWINNNKLYIASPGETYFPTISNSLFAGYTNVTRINFNNVNTIDVTDMTQMFSGDSSLTDVDLSSFNTINVTSMIAMFSACTSLVNINLSYLNTSNVTNMSQMFEGDNSINSINLSNLGSNSLSNIGSMFNGCSSLTNLNMSGFNFGSLTSFAGIFSNGLSSVEVIDLSDIVMTNITHTGSMFYNDANLTTIYVSNTWNVENVNTSEGMFAGCTSLVGGAGTQYDESYTDKEYAIIDGQNSLPGYLTDIADKPAS